MTVEERDASTLVVECLHGSSFSGCNAAPGAGGGRGGGGGGGRGGQASGLPQQVVAAVWAERDKLAAVQAPKGASPGAAAVVGQAVKEGFVAGFRVLMG